MFFLTFLPFKVCSKRIPTWRPGPPTGCWSGLRCAAPPTSAAPKWARSQRSLEPMDEDFSSGSPKKAAIFRCFSSVFLVVFCFEVLQWFIRVESLVVSLCQVGDHPKIVESIGDRRTCRTCNQWSAQCLMAGLRRKFGGGARDEQRRNPRRLVCTPADGAIGGNTAGYRRYLMSLMRMRLGSSLWESGKWLRTGDERSDMWYIVICCYILQFESSRCWISLFQQKHLQTASAKIEGPLLWLIDGLPPCFAYILDQWWLDDSLKTCFFREQKGLYFWINLSDNPCDSSYVCGYPKESPFWGVLWHASWYKKDLKRENLDGSGFPKTVWEGLAVGILGQKNLGDFLREEHYRPQNLKMVLWFNLVITCD